MRLALISLAFVAFTGWSFFITHDDGFVALFELVLRESWAAQMLVDIAISCTVAWTWLWPEARARNIPPLPYVLATVALGSIAVLAFLVHREVVDRRHRARLAVA